MTFPTYTAIAGAMLLLLQQVLMINTGLHRAKSGVNIGAGDDKNLERKIRRHGNLAENAAIFIVMLALVESLTGQTTAILVFALVFVVARFSHAIAFSSLSGSHDLSQGSKIYPALRAVGAFGTFLSGVLISAYAIYLLVFTQLS